MQRTSVTFFTVKEYIGLRGQLQEWDRKKRCDFSFDLKVCNDRADVTSAGRLFHAFAAATEKARSPNVWSRVSGTDSAEVENERSPLSTGNFEQQAVESQISRPRHTEHVLKYRYRVDFKKAICVQFAAKMECKVVQFLPFCSEFWREISHICCLFTRTHKSAKRLSENFLLVSVL